MILSFFIYFFNFSKKLIPLLSLEMMMISLIFCFFIQLKNYCLSVSSVYLVFLVMMVLDSVLGLCLLVGSSRYGSKSSYFFL